MQPCIPFFTIKRLTGRLKRVFARRADTASSHFPTVLFTTIVLTAFTQYAIAGQRPAASVDARQKHQDVTAPGAAVVAEVRKFQAKFPDLMVRYNPRTGGVSTLFSLSRPLTKPSPQNAADIARQFVAGNLVMFGLESSDLQESRIRRNYVSSIGGATHVSVQQQLNGLDVFGAVMNLDITSNGSVLKAGGAMQRGLPHGQLAIQPVLESADAVGRAASQAGVENIHDSKVDGLVYFPISGKDMRLAWNLQVMDGDSPFIYRTLVDAISGEILLQYNTTTMDHIPAHGLVFTNDGPRPGTPADTVGGIVPRDDVPFSGEGIFGHNDPHYDWWDGAPRTTTTSNNVEASEDRNGDGGIGFQPTAMSGEDFSFVLDLTMDPGTENASVQNQSAAIVNLFYRNNWLHDVLYQYGFDEQASNFQTNNFGLGGTGGDPVRADAQDNADNINMPNDGDNLCNAFFNGCGGDGGNRQMTMLLCDRATPLLDGDLDNSVIAHEFGHGVHHRIIPTSCSPGYQGMGEGWGDYWAVSLLAEPGDDINGLYNVGYWLGNMTSPTQTFRRQPYTTDQSVFTRTYANITDNAVCATKLCSDGAGTCSADSDCNAGQTCDSQSCGYHFDCATPQKPFDLGDCKPETHNTGELWAETLWLARANMVIKFGFNVGSTTMNTLVLEGMKYTSPDPTFLDARDGVLLADLVINSGANQCLLWDAFAKMGLGLSAQTVDKNDINPLEAFDTPSDCTPNISVSGNYDIGNVCADDTSTTQVSVNNTGSSDLIIFGIERTSGSEEINLENNPTLPLAIAAGAHVDFTFSCDGLTPGAKTAIFQINSNDADQPAYELELSCNTPEPNLNLSIADSGYFGKVCPTDFADLDLNLLNEGLCDLTVNGINMNPIGSNFELPDDTTYPLVIPGGSDFTIPVRFRPNPGQTCSDASLRTATLTVLSDSPGEESLDVDIKGLMPCPHLVIDPAGLTGDFAFAPTVMDSDGSLGCYTERTTSVRNSGDCPLVIDSISASGDFTVMTPSVFPVVLPKGEETLGVTVRFAPLSAGDPLAPDEFTGLLSVVSNDPNASGEADLCGEGVAQSGVRVLATEISSGVPLAIDNVDNITIRSKGKTKSTTGPINLQFTDLPLQSASICGNTVSWHVDQETLPSTDSSSGGQNDAYSISAKEGNLQASQNFGLGQCEFQEFQMQLLDSTSEACTLLPKGAACTSAGECCSGKCKGPDGGMTCK